MTDRDQTLPGSENLPVFGRSIFPTFNVNVPMPDGTAVPPDAVPASPSAPSAPPPAQSGP